MFVFNWFYGFFQLLNHFICYDLLNGSARRTTQSQICISKYSFFSSFSFLFSFIVSFTKLLQFTHIDREESAECVGAVMMKINNSFLYRQKYFRIGIRVCDRIIHKYIHKTSSTARKMVINDTSMWENSWCNKFNP